MYFFLYLRYTNRINNNNNNHNVPYRKRYTEYRIWRTRKHFFYSPKEIKKHHFTQNH